MSLVDFITSACKLSTPGSATNIISIAFEFGDDVFATTFAVCEAAADIPPSSLLQLAPKLTI